MHVLVIHSDPRFYREVKLLLAAHNASGAYQSSLTGVRHQVEAQHPDLIVLEKRCFTGDEEQLLSQAFTRSHRLPILFLTAASAERIVTGEERNRLSSLVGHLHGQMGATSSKIIQVGELRIHAGRMRVAVNDRWVSLPPIQFRILHQLAVNANELVSHRDLMSHAWGYTGSEEEARELLKVHIRLLRKKLGPEFRDYIQAVRGHGYVLIDPAAEE